MDEVSGLDIPALTRRLRVQAEGAAPHGMCLSNIETLIPAADALDALSARLVESERRRLLAEAVCEALVKTPWKWSSPDGGTFLDKWREVARSAVERP